jgi:hypothetical protein
MNLVAGMRRQPGKFERGNAAAIIDPDDNRLPINPGRCLQHEGKWNFFGLPKRHHGTQGKSVLRKVAHHSAVGRGKFDINEAQRPFSKLLPAIGFQTHGRTC